MKNLCNFFKVICYILNQKTLFLSLQEAKEIIEKWRRDYNQVRPHSSLKGLSPQQFLDCINEQKENKLIA
jgi:putative transposase